MKYYFNKSLSVGFDEAVSTVTEALKAQGFGILTEIDVKATLKKKLDVDFRQYKILGVCNPSLAYQALQAEKKVGLLLPCNVIVYREGNKVSVSMIRPVIAMEMTGNSSLKKIARQADKKFKKVMESLS